MTDQHEITAPGSLLGVDGAVREPGWSRTPVLEVNLPRGLGARFRLKRWDYFGIWAPGVYVSATVSHIGYVGLVFSYAIDLESGTEHEHTRVVPLGRGVQIGDDPHGSTAYRSRGCIYDLAGGDGRRTLAVYEPRLGDGAGLTIDAALDEPAESVWIATPMGGRCFYYNRKASTLRPSGTVRWGDRVIALDPSTCVAQLDWGRGWWPYRTDWVWASANGVLPDGRAIGLNLGATCGDLSAAGEEALVLDGRVHKLGGCAATFTSGSYLEPWRFADTDGRCDVTLTPTVERISKTDLGVVRSEVHQVFGRYDGFVLADDGERILIDGLPGFAEEHLARY